MRRNVQAGTDSILRTRHKPHMNVTVGPDWLTSVFYPSLGEFPMNKVFADQTKVNGWMIVRTR
jgi:hypothetical protein